MWLRGSRKRSRCQGRRPPCPLGSGRTQRGCHLPRWLHGGRRQKEGSNGVALLDSPCALDSLRSEQNDAVVRAAPVTVLGKSRCDSPDFSPEAGPIDLVERVLRSLSSLLWLWSHRLRTTISQPFSVPIPDCDGRRLRVISLDTVASKAFAVRRRRVSPTATGRWLPSFFFAQVNCTWTTNLPREYLSWLPHSNAFAEKESSMPGLPVEVFVLSLSRLALRRRFWPAGQGHPERERALVFRPLLSGPSLL